ncbi:MAG: hypothetical protein IKD72_00495 [Clostridia bacterium]|nr:hypothetical protein [Clostridia bacterium]
MKKVIVILICMLLTLTCLTACKAKLKNGAVLSGGGYDYAAVTNEDGGIQRDEAGNIVVLVTNEKGKNVKGDDGEYATQAVALRGALVVGNRIECPDYSLNIPNGWSDYLSGSDLMIQRDGTKDIIKIITTRDGDLTQSMKQASDLIDKMKAFSADTEYVNRSVKVLDMDGQLFSVFVPDNGSGASSYLGYIFFEHNGVVYSCMLTSDRNMNDKMEDILSILNTIEFVN